MWRENECPETAPFVGFHQLKDERFLTEEYGSEENAATQSPARQRLPRSGRMFTIET
jgi:hypothetical protein